MKKERIQYSFDVWLFIPDEDKLIMNDEDVIIDNRLSKLLNFFCQNPKIVFSRDELINEVWNGSILTDQVITQAIFELRKILKSAERHSMGHIITVPKRGYKLDVDVHKTILVPASVTTNTVSVSDSKVEPSTFNSSPSTLSSESKTTTENDGGNKQQAGAKLEAGTSEPPTNASEDPTTPTTKPNENSGDQPFEKSGSQEPTPIIGQSTTQGSQSVESTKNTINNGEPAPLVTNKPQKKPSRPLILGSVLVLALGLVWWGLKPTSDDLESNHRDNATNESPQELTDSISSTDLSRPNQTSGSHNLDEHKAHKSVHYLSLEPRYIYVNIDDNLKTDAFKRGIIQKLMSYLTTYRDFRIVVNEALVPNSANVVSFKSKIEGDREYLDITYFNRISGFKHLGREYLIDESSLHSTLRTMLDDLLDSFNIDIQKSILKQQTSELPKQEASLRLTFEALGLTFMTLDRTETLQKIIAANELEPDNHFLMSSRYLYELSNIFLLKSTQREKLVKRLNDKFSQELLLAESTPSSYRIYDALAAYSLTQDDLKAAERYMALIPRNELNVMSMIILAKLEESKGNPAAAEEYYYETILESGYPVVLKVAQTLFFNSNISEIESKIGNIE